MYKERLNQIKQELQNMSLEEIAADLKTYVGDLEIEISIVDKKDSGIFFNEDTDK